MLANCIVHVATDGFVNKQSVTVFYILTCNKRSVTVGFVIRFASH